jgi:4-hydroxybenzoate polyprenyltransferase
MACGMLFLPYTGMCLSFVVWGCLLSSSVDFGKMAGIVLIYFLSLGIAAHVADAIGSDRVKPWGQLLSKKQSWLIIIATLVVAYSLGFYYAINFSPYLIVIGLIEGFFLFAYNFELFGGRFHNNFWFSISWGALPFLAGFVIQTNFINLLAILLSLVPFALSYLEIRISRIYKENKRNNIKTEKTRTYESILKFLSLGSIIVTIFILLVVELKISG